MHPMQLNDIEFGVRTPDIKLNATYKYVQKLRTRLEKAYKIAQNVINKEQEFHKKCYDHNI